MSKNYIENERLDNEAELRHTNWDDLKAEREDHVCDPDNPDCRAHLYYADPANRRIAGPSIAAKLAAEAEEAEAGYDADMLFSRPVRGHSELYRQMTRLAYKVSLSAERVERIRAIINHEQLNSAVLSSKENRRHYGARCNWWIDLTRLSESGVVVGFQQDSRPRWWRPAFHPGS